MRCLDGLPELPRGIIVEVFSTPGERFVRGDVFQTRLQTQIRNRIEKGKNVGALSGLTVRPGNIPFQIGRRG
jgi:hypothetical protein